MAQILQSDMVSGISKILPPLENVSSLQSLLDGLRSDGKRLI
jgi:hypothetical protein